MMQTLDQERINKKPRRIGITIGIDEGMINDSIPGFIQTRGNLVDFIKLNGASVLGFSDREGKEKIQAYRNIIGQPQIEVFCGGTTLEWLIGKKGKAGLKEFIELNKRLGLKWVEVSNGILGMNDAEKVKIIQILREEGFKIFSEIGKKKVEDSKPLTIDWWLERATTELAAGAKYIVLQSGKKGRDGIFEENREPKEALIEELVEVVGLKKIIFEAPHDDQQAYLIRKYRANVNLGNIRMGYLFNLEESRNGRRPGTLEFSPREWYI